VQLGRPWNKVFSEICAGIDRRNTVQQHIHQHIRDFIAIEVGVLFDWHRGIAASRAALQRRLKLFHTTSKCFHRRPLMSSLVVTIVACHRDPTGNFVETISQ